MLVKMRRDATPDEIEGRRGRSSTSSASRPGKMVGEEITLIGVYGDISTPAGRARSRSWPGVEQLIPISRAYKRVAQKGDAGAADLPDGAASATWSAAATTSSSSRARARSRASRRSWRPPAW